MTEIEYINILENVRRTAERGLTYSQNYPEFTSLDKSTFVDLFQHILDELER